MGTHICALTSSSLSTSETLSVRTVGTSRATRGFMVDFALSNESSTPALSASSSWPGALTAGPSIAGKEPR